VGLEIAFLSVGFELGFDWVLLAVVKFRAEFGLSGPKRESVDSKCQHIEFILSSGFGVRAPSKIRNFVGSGFRVRPLSFCIRNAETLFDSNSRFFKL
jgi:hypothetical protein